MRDWLGTAMVDASVLHERMRVLAALDIILSEEAWLRVHRYRYNIFQPDMAWGSVDNGAGDHLHVLFANTGTLIKGFDHESPLSPHNREDGEIYPGMYDEVPESFMKVLREHEDALNREDVTFCFWQEGRAPGWKAGSWIELAMAEEDEEYASGGFEFLLGYIEATPEGYIDWAEGYYDIQEMSLTAVTEIYNNTPVTADLIRRLNPKRDVLAAINELQQCGCTVERRGTD
ncbi:hypothetical protein HNR77_001357 [Paenibacillus sp. JGP012]|uniref:hypothetical protein n=1 Tax=Paenibacillus sp. JGP012 TaxID=2735914 RepID=UPI0016191314|nr:hypothetical protein [Paenibacillus sp. JGP012]MBB6020296.1 hypothetical protein [Paenibacillus sp. JGP012]